MPTKKTTKKSAKKATKRSSKKKKVMVCADGTHCFWVHNGPVLKDIEELHHALKEMSDDMFSYHVGKGRNDFADWVEHVLDDKTLATSLRKARKVSTSARAVAKGLKEYK